MSPATKISLCTVRLECQGPTSTSVGTGYLYGFQIKDDEIFPVLVTNKHVVRGRTRLNIEFNVIKQGDEVCEDASAVSEERVATAINNLADIVIMHPDEAVDLCVIPLGNFLNSIKPGYGIKNSLLTKDWRLTTGLAPTIRPIETIVMIGYPDGLWDEVNNRPLARRGLTASHALTRWNGKRQFVIDAACFHGSSGSPVFLYDDGVIRSSEGSFSLVTRAILLGTLCSGPTVNAKGELVEVEAPTTVDVGPARRQIPVVQTMMNLGYVVHADALDDFIPLIRDFVPPN
ncbi:S1 family peptidase [Pseudomonas sp. S1_F04]